MDTFIDVKFQKDDILGYADIAYNADGDLIVDNSFDTTLQIAIGTDGKASDEEVPRKDRQRGAIMDLFNNYKNGSLLWLLSQARANTKTKNDAISYIYNALRFLVDDGFLKNIYVSGSLKTNGIELNIILEQLTGTQDKYKYEAWNNSLYKA